MADMGYIALVLALAVSVYATIASVIGARKGHLRLIASARIATITVGGLVFLAALVLIYALLTHNFQIEYVAQYSSRDMSPAYTLAAFYAGNKGSLLLWALLLSLFAVVMVLQNKNRELMPYASAVVMAIDAFFLLLLVNVANPFHKLSIVPADGRGLNPLLENPAMLFHPPFLLAGYVGFSIPFAFAIAALITRRLDNEWLRSMRRWVLFAWLLLGVGNLLGAWWAYMELGWGGYWGWDAVENAGLMPWLMATAFLHSSMLQERKGMLKIWNMALIILIFELVIFGTFLTRSGILSSVHAFSQSAMGPFFLVLIGLTLLGSLWLLISRLGLLKSEGKSQFLLSRENIFLLSNLILVAATLLIFEGTVFPAVSQFILGVRIDLGASFFNRVTVPLIFLQPGQQPSFPGPPASDGNLLRHRLAAQVGQKLTKSLSQPYYYEPEPDPNPVLPWGKRVVCSSSLCSLCLRWLCSTP